MCTESRYLIDRWTHDDNVNKGGPASHGHGYHNPHSLYTWVTSSDKRVLMTTNQKK